MLSYKEQIGDIDQRQISKASIGKLAVTAAVTVEPRGLTRNSSRFHGDVLVESARWNTEESDEI